MEMNNTCALLVNVQFKHVHVFLCVLRKIKWDFYHSKVIDAFFWRCQFTNRKFFTLSSSFYLQIVGGGSPNYMLRGDRLKDVEMIVVPMNVSGHHWTLLVSIACCRKSANCNAEKLIRINDSCQEFIN